MGKKSRRSKTTAPFALTCEIFGCECKQVYSCKCCKKRVCAAHFFGMGCVVYEEALPIKICAQCPFCKQVNDLPEFDEANVNKLKNSLSEFTHSNGDMKFELAAATLDAETRDAAGCLLKIVGTVTLEYRPCSCCAGKLRFSLSSKCSM